ncbi:MAG: FKBP-type peptidyl-prolyl cis-trans isomerase [Candidatus Woesearchaeota archaeon]
MIQKGDFVQLDFTAKVNATGMVFDTTLESEAKKHNIYNKDIVFKPAVICVGERQLLTPLDDFLIGKALGKYSLSIENAFGKKDAKLLRLISIKEFHKHKINPVPGLEVELDDRRGIVRTVNGGRVIVDFNNPLASQDITYDVELRKIVEDESEKVRGVLEFLKIPYKSVETDADKAFISFGVEVPKELNEPIAAEIKRLTKMKDVEFK